MNMTARLLCTLWLMAAVLAPCAALADPAIIYLVRHGEKEATGKDPALTPQGQARAQYRGDVAEGGHRQRVQLADRCAPCRRRSRWRSARR